MHRNNNNNENKEDNAKGTGVAIYPREMFFLQHLALRLVFKDEQGYLTASLGWRLLLQGIDEKAQQTRGKAVPRSDSSPWTQAQVR